MIESLLIIFICVTLVTGFASAYFYAESRSKNTLVSRQEEWLVNLRKDNGELLAKLLVKNGLTPIGYEPKPREPSNGRDGIREPRIVTRSQMEARAHDSRESANITIHANKVSYPRVSDEVLEKAKNIVGNS